MTHEAVVHGIVGDDPVTFIVDSHVTHGTLLIRHALLFGPTPTNIATVDAVAVIAVIVRWIPIHRCRSGRRCCGGGVTVHDTTVIRSNSNSSSDKIKNNTLLVYGLGAWEMVVVVVVVVVETP